MSLPPNGHNGDLFRGEQPQSEVRGIRFSSLGSGSKGNGTVVIGGRTTVLIDCGFNVKQTIARLKRIGIEAASLNAILVTHEHADHASGVVTLSHRFDIPVYASHGTHKALRSRDLDPRFKRPFVAARPFEVGDLRIHPVPVPHDAREPTQYVVEHATVETSVCFGILTDIGHPTRHVIESYKRCNGLLVEGNHDPVMLMNGAYPPRLKRRIASDLGHMSNAQTASFLDSIMHDALTHIVIGHVSEQNNDDRRLREAFDRFETVVANFAYASQTRGVGWVDIDPPTPQTRQAELG